jgi:hypothetical protein
VEPVSRKKMADRILDSPPNVAIAPAISNTRKRMREDKRDSSGRKIVMVPSSEFLSKFVEWRKSRLESLPSNRNFDRWYEALSKESIWHQWMLDGLVNIEIPTRNTLAHMYDSATSKRPKKNLLDAFNGNTPSSSSIM